MGGCGGTHTDCYYGAIVDAVLAEVVEALRDEGAKNLDGVPAYDNGSLEGRAEMRRDQKHYYLAAILVEEQFGGRDA